MKKLARRIVATILGWQVRRLQKKKKFQVVAVAGSVGKTSTKLAIAEGLSAGKRVLYQVGNYNDRVTVPLIYFNQLQPSLFNPLAWLAVFVKNELKLYKTYPYDVVVVELGTDGPGFMDEFKDYVIADIGVLSAIAPEHMEYFKSLDAVAEEEMKIAEVSKRLVVNADMCDERFRKDADVTYAIDKAADYKMANIKFDDSGCDFDVLKKGKKLFSGRHEIFAEPQLYSVLAAVTVAELLGLGAEDIERGLATIKPFPGRMNKLAGIKNSTIIDDTYNASPEAMKAALRTLYRLKAPQKIAVLGNMNELGDFSKKDHEEIGNLCDPKQIDLVVTIGPDANKYLAAAAKARGCRVESFDSPFDAGDFVKDEIKDDALVLVKGSQNKVFAEEAIKALLANPSDAHRLVRQSDNWLKVKAKNFK